MLVHVKRPSTFTASQECRGTCGRLPGSQLQAGCSQRGPSGCIRFPQSGRPLPIPPGLQRSPASLSRRSQACAGSALSVRGFIFDSPSTLSLHHPPFCFSFFFALTSASISPSSCCRLNNLPLPTTKQESRYSTTFVSQHHLRDSPTAINDARVLNI